MGINMKISVTYKSILLLLIFTSLGSLASINTRLKHFSHIGHSQNILVRRFLHSYEVNKSELPSLKNYIKNDSLHFKNKEEEAWFKEALKYKHKQDRKDKCLDIFIISFFATTIGFIVYVPSYIIYCEYIAPIVCSDSISKRIYKLTSRQDHLDDKQILDDSSESLIYRLPYAVPIPAEDINSQIQLQ